MTTWFLIPARGGSRGIPRKNVRRLAGKPLIQYVLETVRADHPVEHVYVSTDGDEIAHVAAPWATIHARDPGLADAASTLDDVAADFAAWLVREQGASAEDVLITIQPTSPFLTAASIQSAVDKVAAGAASVLSAKDDRHLRWRLGEDGSPEPAYAARVNRQWLPPEWVETGGIIGCRIGPLIERRTRIQSPTELVVLDGREGLDIDDHADWALAEHHARRLRILIRADAAPGLGMGHVYRAVALGMAFLHHEVHLVTRSDGPHALGASFLADAPFRVTALPQARPDPEEAFFELADAWQPDILITDILDTQVDWMERAATGRFVAAFEDLGPGASVADLVVNDLYTGHTNGDADRVLEGIEYSIVAPHFETVEPRPMPTGAVERVLVTFGGTDPSGLTELALQALGDLEADLRDGLQVTVVLGPGREGAPPDLATYGLHGEVLSSVSNMALLMADADLALTSAGRTVTELLSLGIPSVVLCQNARELSHTHASEDHGARNLGLGSEVSRELLCATLRDLCADVTVRRRMHEKALAATRGRSNEHIAQRVIDAFRAKQAVTEADA